MREYEIIELSPQTEPTITDATSDIEKPPSHGPSNRAYWGGIAISLLVLWIIFIIISMMYQTNCWMTDSLLSLRIDRSLEILAAVSTKEEHRELMKLKALVTDRHSAADFIKHFMAIVERHYVTTIVPIRYVETDTQ